MQDEKLKELIKNITQKNEAEANLIAAKVMRVTLYVFFIIYLLNLTGIFVIEQKSMNITFFASAVFLFTPTIINKIFPKGRKWLKYIYVFLSACFSFLASTTITDHAVIAYIYPILIAALYFDLPLTRVATLLTCIITAIGQLIGFKLNLLHDANFNNFFSIVVFSILPKLMCLFALSCIVILISTRTDKLLKKQIVNTHQIANLNNEIIVGFATFVESKDNSTGEHILRTSRYAELLAKELKKNDYFKDEITDEFIENLKTAAPLHDIGKVGIPDSILQKKGKLTADEYEIMKTHSTKGGDILQGSFCHMGNESFRKMAVEITTHHHEKWNGKGYPAGLKENQIPLSARIMSIADVFDAVSEDRCYRPALSLEESFSIIKNGRGIDFDPIITDTFLRLRNEVQNIHARLK